MTYKEALTEFRARVLPYVRKHHETPYSINRSARAEAWSVHVDSLRRAGVITDKQYETWPNPYTLLDAIHRMTNDE